MDLLNNLYGQITLGLILTVFGLHSVKSILEFSGFFKNTRFANFFHSSPNAGLIANTVKKTLSEVGLNDEQQEILKRTNQYQVTGGITFKNDTLLENLFSLLAKHTYEGDSTLYFGSSTSNFYLNTKRKLKTIIKINDKCRF